MPPLRGIPNQGTREVMRKRSLWKLKLRLQSGGRALRCKPHCSHGWHMRGMTEGLTPYTAAPAPQRLGYKPRPPVGTKLGAGTETWRGDLWGNPRVADSPAQRTTQEATGARVNLNPETLGPVKSRTAAPPEQPPPGPQAGLPHTRLGSSPPRPRSERRPPHEGVEP